MTCESCDVCIQKSGAYFLHHRKKAFIFMYSNIFPKPSKRISKFENSLGLFYSIFEALGKIGIMAEVTLGPQTSLARSKPRLPWKSKYLE